VTLRAAGNYYSYRDGKLLIDLDASTGIYRKLTLAETKDQAIGYRKGALVFAKENDAAFTRQQGCFYVRTGTGVDASFGTQILLDSDKLIASEYFVPFEIFRIEDDGPSSMFLRRFDYIDNWNGRFCPELSTPWDFCNLLRNGNIMFYPNLTPAQLNQLLDEAIKIRTEFSFSKSITKSQFDALWEQVPETSIEAIRTDWVYEVDFLVDTPPWIDQAWRDYVMGKRPRMPELGPSKELPRCYPSKREVILADGSRAWISGEVCYEGGQFTFTGF
jgi:hypothetical protein